MKSLYIRGNEEAINKVIYVVRDLLDLNGIHIADINDEVLDKAYDEANNKED